MKTIDFFELDIFKLIRQKMGIQKNYYTGCNLNEEFRHSEWIDPLKEGKEIPADDPNLTHDSKGIYYEGRKVLVYIRDQDINFREQKKESGYKYHITWCKTLADMQKKGRSKRYVVSTNTDGKFKINYVDGTQIVETVEERLHVCKNCLKQLNWKNYDNVSWARKERIYEEFSLEEFFESNDNDNQLNFAFIPNQTDITAPVNVYSPEWSVISRILRKSHMFCTECRREVTIDEIGQLHVHHIDGDKSNNNPSNLLVLCEDCHQKQHPTHNILKKKR